MIDRKIPETVEVDGLPWTFVQCVKHVVDTNPQFRGRVGVFMAERLVVAIDGKNPGDAFSWKEKDWKALDDAFTSPASGYTPTAFLNGNPVQVGGRHFTSYLLTISGDEEK